MANREENYDHVVVPAAEYVKGARFKEDFYNAGTGGEEKAQQGFFTRLMQKGVEWFGYDGKPQPKGGRQYTSLATFLGYADYNQAKLEAKLDAVIVGLGKVAPEVREAMQEEFKRSLAEGLGTFEFKVVPKEETVSTPDATEEATK